MFLKKGHEKENYLRPGDFGAVVESDKKGMYLFGVKPGEKVLKIPVDFYDLYFSILCKCKSCQTHTLRSIEDHKVETLIEYMFMIPTTFMCALGWSKVDFNNAYAKLKAQLEGLVDVDAIEEKIKNLPRHSYGALPPEID